MTDKELRKLRREDLLQILIGQQRQIEELTQALEESEKALRDRKIQIEESGSIAEAALKLNDVFARAQDAADHYLEESRRHADALREEAERTELNARKSAEDIVNQARSEAERLLGDARREGGRIRAEAAQAREVTEQPVQPPEIRDEKKRGGFLRRNRQA